jgi:hypothetical protein
MPKKMIKDPSQPQLFKKVKSDLPMPIAPIASPSVVLPIASPLVQQYMTQLSAMEKIVLKIAQEHLETSFNLEKSIGYEQWLKKQPTSIKN